MSIPSDLTKVADIIQDVAARIIEPRFQKLEEVDIHEKTSPSDLVTIADIEAEKELERILCDYLPGSIAMGEEAISRGEKMLEALASTDETFWVIDPVDGTFNFSNSIPKFGSMVALVHKGETVQSWIYHIPQKHMMMAEKGAGTLANGNKVPLFDNPGSLSEITGFISVKFAPKEIKALVEKNRDKFGSVDAHFCCAHEYTMMIRGEADYALYTRTKPWDHLPGELILREAGSIVRKWDDTPYTPLSNDRGLLAARTPKLWGELHDIIIKPYFEEKGISF